MKELTYWDVIKSFYKNTFNIPTLYIDYIACYPILIDCVTGYSNASISRRNRVPEDYVQDVIIDFLNFLGWEEDLDINPYAIYKKTSGNFEFFTQEVLISSAYLTLEDIKFIFRICKRFNKLKSWADEVEKTIV
ncbi:MAG: hypothetical protein QXV73_05120 [Candidatus Micrarchaeia archaeon]